MHLEEVTLIDYGHRNWNVVLNTSEGSVQVYHAPVKESRVRDFLVNLMAREDVPLSCVDAGGRRKPLPDFIADVFRFQAKAIEMAPARWD